MANKKNGGRFTLPVEHGFLNESISLINRWGADAIRDCDGTCLESEYLDLSLKTYKSYFITRGHNDFMEENMDLCQEMLLMSKRNTAISDTLSIDIMDGFYKEQLKIDDRDISIKYWEVIDRTSGILLDKNNWSYKDGKVNIISALPFHEYTVSFFVYLIWDPTQMYNHITNDWGDKAHEIPLDIRSDKAFSFAKKFFSTWLLDNPNVNLVRFTTFFYHFTLIFNEDRKEKFVDWFGYSASVSPECFEDFKKENGFSLRAEDIVDNGYFNNPFRDPSENFLKYMDFTARFVCERASVFVKMAHDAGKEAMMFLGDNWIGTEPYGKYFNLIGLDSVAGSVGDAATLRMISEIPNLKYTEGRFLPYFFPDTFKEGNNPEKEAIEMWSKARRAMMRKPLDRMGYGGYPSLAYKFPDFLDTVENISNEFRSICEKTKDTKPYHNLKVAVLNSWGKLRSWQCFMVAHAIAYKETEKYIGILESLAGAALSVEFISFNDIRENGIDKDIDVIINAGPYGSAYSGYKDWLDPEILSSIRKWVYEGGGFIGIGVASAARANGRYFQLADVLGVEKEECLSLSYDKYFNSESNKHFILENIENPYFGECREHIYSISKDTEIIKSENGDILLSSHDYGKGRGLYIAGLPYSFKNTEILKRAIYYSANMENIYNTWRSLDERSELHLYKEKNLYAVTNNSSDEFDTVIYKDHGEKGKIHLKPYELVWKNI